MLDIIEVQNLINLFSYSISHFQLQQGFGNFSLCTLAVSLSHFAASSFSEMATFSSSITMAKNPQTQFLSGNFIISAYLILESRPSSSLLRRHTVKLVSFPSFDLLVFLF